MGALTSIGTFTKITGSEFGDKRIWIGTWHVGDGAGGTWSTGGFAITPSAFVMDSVDDILFDGGTLLYKFNGTSILAYTAHATPNPNQILIQANGSAPHEDIRIMVIGNGGGS